MTRDPYDDDAYRPREPFQSAHQSQDPYDGAYRARQPGPYPSGPRYPDGYRRDEPQAYQPRDGSDRGYRPGPADPGRSGLAAALAIVAAAPRPAEASRYRRRPDLPGDNRRDRWLHRGQEHRPAHEHPGRYRALRRHRPPRPPPLLLPPPPRRRPPPPPTSACTPPGSTRPPTPSSTPRPGAISPRPPGSPCTRVARSSASGLSYRVGTPTLAGTSAVMSVSLAGVASRLGKRPRK